MNAWLKRYARIGLALVVAVLLIAALSGSAAAAGPVYHTVLPGQTLYSIANYYGVSVWAISCANGIYNPNYIYAGMVLMIPYGGYGYCKPPYKPPVYNPYPDHHFGHFCFYRVQWGDNLFRIGLKFGLSWVVLAHVNGLYNPNQIYAGMVLKIPNCDP